MIKNWKIDLQHNVKSMFFGNLNVGAKVPEGPSNRRACMALLTGSADAILATPYQWHSADCVVIDRKPDTPPKGDALVTATPGLAIGVVTADCAPVLFAGVTTDGRAVIGAAHAGARGALKGVLAATIKAMRGLGAQDIKAAIGPCIHPESYEVGVGFYDEFIAQDADTKAFFATRGEKYSFDLPGYVAHLLRKDGVIFSDVGVDTYASPDCFSYRLSTHRGEPDYGRALSAIMISAARP